MTFEEMEEATLDALSQAYQLGQIPIRLDAYEIDAWVMSETERLEWAKHTTPQEILSRLLQLSQDMQTENYIDELRRRLRSTEK